MSSDIVISARNLTKTYRAYKHPLGQLLGSFIPGMAKHCKEFHALNDVSFDIRRGETVGIIGRNGSGKSTLLQLICGIRKPTSGSLQVNGRISALLELGAGFHPEFTGRENVFMQGAIQGMSRQEMEARFDDIAAFADIGEYIDQPVKTYSSGMFVRLAFAVAVSVEPDILVVDEALAVGDFVFRSKCYERIKHLTRNGTTLFFVSHDLETTKIICSRVMYLDAGIAKSDGPSAQVCDLYFGDYVLQTNVFLNGPEIENGTLESKQRIAEILEVSMRCDRSDQPNVVPFGAEVVLTVRHIVHANLDSLTLAFHVRDCRGVDLVGTNTRLENCDINSPLKGATRTTEFRFSNRLRDGEYNISVGLAADISGSRCFPDWMERAIVFKSLAAQRWSLISPVVQITHRST